MGKHGCRLTNLPVNSGCLWLWVSAGQKDCGQHSMAGATGGAQHSLAASHRDMVHGSARAYNIIVMSSIYWTFRVLRGA